MQTIDALRDVAQRLEVAGREDRLQCASPQAARKSPHLVVERRQLPVSTCSRVMTMSISSAPVRDRGLDLLELAGRCGMRPAGNPVETAATGMPDALERLDGGRDEAVVDADRADRDASRSGEAERLEDVAADRARAPWRRAARTRSGVSSPLSVVRSMQVIALSSQAACASFLTVRRPGRRRDAPLGGGQIDPDLVDPVHLQRMAFVAGRCRAGA